MWVTELAKAKTGSFEIPPGVHDLRPGGLRIANATDLHVLGNGATLRFDPYGKEHGLVMRNCKNVRLEGVRFETPGSYSKCKILKSDEWGFEVRQLNDRRPHAEGITKIVAFRDGKFVNFKRQYSNKVEQRKENEFRIWFPRPANPLDGMLPDRNDILYLGNRQGASAVILNQCTDCTLADVIVHSSGNVAFYEQFCANTHYESCHVRPKDDEFFSSNADAFHSLDATHAPSMIDCSVRGSGDDPVNVHGKMLVHAERGIILYETPTQARSGTVWYGPEESCEIKVGAVIDNPRKRDELGKKVGLLQVLWKEATICEAECPDLPVGEHFWYHFVEGGALLHFTARDCWTNNLKWRSGTQENPFRIERAFTRRAGKDKILTKAEKQWLEGPDGVGEILDSVLDGQEIDREKTG